MAANFWSSSHFLRWTFSKDQIAKMRSDLQARSGLTPEKELVLQSHFVRLITAIGKKLQFKQLVLATAIVFYKRFYLKHSAFEYDPRIVALTCLYLAVKVEEMGQLRPDHVVNQSNNRPENLDAKTSFKVKPIDIFTCEMTLLESLSFDLVVFHPYFDLHRLAIDAAPNDCNVLFTDAWKVVNDSMKSDCMLVYPPCIIALAAIYIASAVNPNLDIKSWFDDLNLNLEQVRECCRELLEAARLDEERGRESKGVFQELADHWRSKRLSSNPSPAKS